MKYLWIIMLIIIEVIWLIATIKDVYDQLTGFWKFPYCLKFMEWYSYVFIIGHLSLVFWYSLALYFKW